MASPGNNSSDYDWNKCKEMSPTKLHAILEDRRQQLLDMLPEFSKTTHNENLVQEWIALVTARDKLLKRKFVQENQKLMDEYMLDLYQTLQDIGQLKSYNTRHSLKSNLSSLYNEVKNYCKERKIEAKKILKNSENIPTVPLIPPPPPPPMTPNSRSRRKGRKSLGARPKIKTPGMQKIPEKATMHSLDPELRKNITDGKHRLRSTPYKRSPGGTPFRVKRRTSVTSPSGLMQYALQRKFRSVRQSTSPIHSNDETDSRESSFTISID